jgi:hypothetical protein
MEIELYASASGFSDFPSTILVNDTNQSLLAGV